MSFVKLDITTTNGQVFTGEESTDMAFLVYKRFGRDIGAAHTAWNRMLRNNCSLKFFVQLVERGQIRKIGRENSDLLPVASNAEYFRSTID